MDTLHDVLRAIHETKARADHLSVFREFLGHLDKISKRAVRRPPAKSKTKRKAKT